jgi:hypothetical protein
MDRRPLVVLVLVAGLAAAAVPAAATHQQVKVPPRWSGMGNTDVTDEPSTEADQVAPTNGFDGKDYPDVWFDDPDGEQILDSFYEYNAAQVDVDVNKLLRTLASQTGQVDHEKHMLFGFGLFQAWWGWWQDRGEGHLLHEQGLGTDEADGAIDDAHDDADTWDDDPQNGAWDEFVWRGTNPWADDHPRMPHERKPGDRMLMFLQPGTIKPHVQQTPVPTRSDSAYVLRNDADDPETPDVRYEDRTSNGAYTQRPVPQWGGWVTENGYPVGNMDRGYLVTAKVWTSVNPTSVPGGFDRDSGDAVDLDVYTALHPSVETAYRATVWDPGDEQQGPVRDAVDDEGPKQEAKDRFTALWTGGETAAMDLASEAVDPAAPAAGAADDAAGRHPRTHEPNHPDDAYGLQGGPTDWATHDPDTAYGGLGGSSYYRPGGEAWDPSSPNAGTQTYDGYTEERPWLDIQAGFGVPVYGFALTMMGSGNVFPAPNADAPLSQGEQGAASPGLLTFAGHFGLWHDASGDTWVGDLGEPGRWTSPDDPYNDGLGNPTAIPDEPIYQDRANDPNDYGDTAEATAATASKSLPFEWRPLCQDAQVTVTVEPMTDDGRWGAAGVYVIQDRGGQHNPYDDVVSDTAGDGPWGQDGDGERLSRHVLEGPIDLNMRCQDPKRGEWFSDDQILLPAGSATYEIRATAQGKVLGEKLTRTDNVDVGGTVIRDVDVVPSWS